MDKASSRICPQCGKAFAPKRKNNRYCCVKCLHKAYRLSHLADFAANSKRWRKRHPRPSSRKTLQELECPHCGKTFRQTHPRQKYCCTRCAMGASHNRRRDKINERARTYYRLKHPKGEKRLCSFCGAEFVPVQANSTCCSRSCSIRLSRFKHKEQIRIWNASYHISPGARILREMRRVAYNEILESDPEAYAEHRRKSREKSRKRVDRTRCRTYAPRLRLRFPDYVCKAQDMLEVYSPKFCETSFEGNAFARELRIERDKQTGRFKR